MKLYDHPLSGNGHKVRLLVSMLGLEIESILVDVPNGAHHDPNFGAINPLHQIPVLVDGEITIRDSQAILVYLARRYGPEWLPWQPLDAGRVMQWLAFAALEIATSLQAARVYYLLGEECDIAKAQERGCKVLRILDDHLTHRAWLECDQPTIADLACFPYVGLCREGKLSLDDYTNVLVWIDRIRALPGYTPMPGLGAPLERPGTI